MRFGLTLPNRGVLFGVTTPEQMLQMARIADESDVFQSVWVGDSLLGKPRMESITLLAGVEPILTSAPKGRQGMVLGNWSLDMGGGMAFPQ